MTDITKIRHIPQDLSWLSAKLHQGVARVCSSVADPCPRRFGELLRCPRCREDHICHVRVRRLNLTTGKAMSPVGWDIYFQLLNNLHQTPAASRTTMVLTGRSAGRPFLIAASTSSVVCQMISIHSIFQLRQCHVRPRRARRQIRSRACRTLRLLNNDNGHDRLHRSLRYD